MTIVHTLQRHRFSLALFGVLLACVLIAFGQSFGQGFAPIDDAYLIVNNPLIRGITWENVKGVFSTFDPELYIPFTLMSFQLNYLVSALDPWFFHLTNLILHAVNALLVYAISRKMTDDKTGSAIIALIFAMHPLHSESVVWLAGRKDLLSAFFAFGSFLLYLSYRDGSRWKAYAFSIVLFVCALLSKVSVATLPAVLVLYDVFIEQRSLKNKIFYLDKIPFALLSLVFLLVATLGKERVLASATLMETALMAAKSSTFYIQKFLLPTGLHPLHPYEGSITFGFIDFWPHVLIVGLLLATAIRYWKKLPWISFCIFFYFVTLAPSFFNFRKGELNAIAVERYAYIPSIGLLLLLMIPLSWIVQRMMQSDDKRIVGIGAGMVLTIGLMAASVRQTGFWAAPETLFARGVAIYPASAINRSEYVRTLRELGRTSEAFEVLKEGLRYSDSWLLHKEAGLIYAKTGNIADAREQFRIATEKAPHNPEPAFNMGSLEYKLGNAAVAKPYLEKAVELDPSYVVARVMLGKILLEQGDNEAAAEQFKAALEWNPYEEEARALLEAIKK